MLGGLLLIFLALLGYMAFSPWVIPPFALICAAAWVFRPRRGKEPSGWSWRAYLAGLPVITLVTALAYALGWGMRVWLG